MEDILIPIFVSCIMPVAIVYIVFWTVRNKDNRNAEVLTKAIESGNIVDADKLAEALRKQQKSSKELLNERLLRGCIFSLTGLTGIVFSTLMICFSTGMSDFMGLMLLLGGIIFALGVSFLIVFFYSRRVLKEETEHNTESR